MHKSFFLLFLFLIVFYWVYLVFVVPLTVTAFVPPLLTHKFLLHPEVAHPPLHLRVSFVYICIVIFQQFSLWPTG